MVNVILLVVVACLIIIHIGLLYERSEHEEKINDLKVIIAIYDKSDKVIKDCVVYTPDKPVTVTGDHLAFIGCTFQHTGLKAETKVLKKILGI